MSERFKFVLAGEGLDSFNLVVGKAENVLNGNGNRPAVTAQNARPNRAVEILYVLRPNLREKDMIKLSPLMAADGLTLKQPPRHRMRIPALHWNFPDLINMRVVLKQPGAMRRNGPGYMGVRIIMAQLPGEDRRIGAVAVGGKLA